MFECEPEPSVIHSADSFLLVMSKEGEEKDEGRQDKEEAFRERERERERERLWGGGKKEREREGKREKEGGRVMVKR